MSTATLPDVDEQTRNDLQPPCEARQECDRPAEWITRFAAACDHIPAVALCCTHHTQAVALAAHKPLMCAVCSVPVIVSGIERL